MCFRPHQSVISSAVDILMVTAMTLAWTVNSTQTLGNLIGIWVDQYYLQLTNPSSPNLAYRPTVHSPRQCHRYDE